MGFLPRTDRKFARMKLHSKTALFLAVAAFIVYNLNFRVVGTGDSYSARVQPFALLTQGTLNLDGFRTVATEDNPTPYWLQPTLGGHTASLFPVITPVLVTPLYLLPALYLSIVGWSDQKLQAWVMIMEKVAASTVVALAVAFMYMVLRRRCSDRTAVLLTVAFAFATGTWSTSSQALWLHGAAELFLAVALWLITGPLSSARAAFAGAAIALIACNRPPDLFLAASLCLPALLWAKDRFVWVIATGAAVCLATLSYNYLTFGSLVGAWHVVGDHIFFSNSHPLEGIAGLLFSPARGLFVFSPWLLALPIGIWWILQSSHQRLLGRCLLAGIAVTTASYALTPWHAGDSYGPRYMIDLIPAIVWLMAPAVDRLMGLRRMAFIGLICFSAWVEYIGAFHYNGISNVTLVPLGPFNSAPLWSHVQFLMESKNGRQPASLLTTIRQAF